MSKWRTFRWAVASFVGIVGLALVDLGQRLQPKRQGPLL